MADNTQLSAAVGSGDTIATDDISGVKYQRIKLIHGADGVNAGDISTANPLPVGDAGGTLTVDAPVGTPVFVRLSDGSAAITTLPVSVSGVASAANQATEIASLASIDGKITAVNTGAVVVSSSALPSGAATAAKQPALGTAGTASADVITIQGIASGTVVPVSDGGGILTVDGTVAVTQSGTWDEVGINDSGNSITVDAPVATPVFVRLSDGASAVAPALETGGNLAAAATSLGVMDDWDNAASDGASVSGDTAHDTADAGEPVKCGAKATTALSALTLVADADRTNLFAGIDGVQIIRPHCNLEDIVSGNASNTDGTSTQCIAAQASGIKTYLTSVLLTNTSSSMIYVEIKDGTTVKVTIPVPATGGAIFNPPVPIPGTAATAWNFDASAATTTVYCSMLGFKSKV